MDDLLSGRAKLYLIRRVLQLRAQSQGIFQRGDYLPLIAQGERSHHLIAFTRNYQEQGIIVAAPRFTDSLMRGRSAPPVGDVWGNTHFTLPSEEFGGIAAYENVLTRERVAANEKGQLLCRELFRSFPFALLTSA
jgi:(1->4)-alpha-D-glucan 1-alpha-D-glucosylmutase